MSSPLPGSLLAGVAALVITAACASVTPPGTSPAAPAEPLTHATAIEQSLFRLTYDGGDGRTGLKVVLRRAATDDRFQLVVSDLAGRRVWSLDHSAKGMTLVDHRASTYCLSGPDLRLPEVHPQELPVAAIPRVLAGRLPVEDDPASVDGELIDDSGRRWRRSYADNELVAWTLFDARGPALWWARDRDGGLLSRRGGVQYRWQLVVSEPSSEPLSDLVPAGFSRGSCGE